MVKQTICPRKNFLTLALLSPLALFAPWVTASEVDAHEHKHKQKHRQHGAHEHGVGKINIAQDGKELHIELDSPAANIVGFEHIPETALDRDSLTKALALLKNGTRLFLFPDAAECNLVDTAVATPLKEHGNGEEAHHTEDAVQQHAREHTEEPHVHEGGQKHQGETHTDITATWRFSCRHPEALDQVSVQLFEAFPMTERLQVQFITGKRQGAAELSASQPAVRF